MGQRAAAGTGSQGRALARAARLCLGRPLALVLLLAGLVVSQPCRADDPVRGEATFTSGGGFARLVLKLAEDVESEVSTAGSIIIIHFKRPVDIPVEKLSDAVPDYVGSARRDPDGTAIRLSLSRRATVNTMTAGERIFVDFLPDSWTGPPPALPAAVVRELAERARVAERALARAARGQCREEAAAGARPRFGAADLRPLRVRDARRRQRVVGAERTEADAAVHQRAQFRPGGRQGGGAAERRLDQPAGRRRFFRRRHRADRRGRRAFLPRGKELCDRRRLPAGGKARCARSRRPRPSRPHRPSPGLPRGRRATRPRRNRRRRSRWPRFRLPPRRRLPNRPRSRSSPPRRPKRRPWPRPQRPPSKKSLPSNRDAGQRSAAPAAEKIAAAPEKPSPPAEAAKAPQPAEQVEAPRGSAEGRSAQAGASARSRRNSRAGGIRSAAGNRRQGQGRHRRGEA